MPGLSPSVSHPNFSITRELICPGSDQLPSWCECQGYDRSGTEVEKPPGGGQPGRVVVQPGVGFTIGPKRSTRDIEKVLANGTKSWILCSCEDLMTLLRFVVGRWQCWLVLSVGSSIHSSTGNYVVSPMSDGSPGARRCSVADQGSPHLFQVYYVCYHF